MIVEYRKAEALLAMPKEEQDRFLESFARHTLQLIYTQHRPITEEVYDALCHKVFWKTCIELKRHHAERLVRLYPEAGLLLRPVGPRDDQRTNLDDRAVDHFTDCLCIFLTGSTWHNTSQYRYILERQFKDIFLKLDEDRESRDRRMNMSMHDSIFGRTTRMTIKKEGLNVPKE